MKLKKTLTVLLTVILILSSIVLFTGCNDAEEKETTTTEATTTEATTTEATTTEATTTEATTTEEETHWIIPETNDAVDTLVEHELLAEDEERPRLDNMILGAEQPWHASMEGYPADDIYGFGGNPSSMTDGDTSSSSYAGLGITHPVWVAFEFDEEAEVDLVKFWPYYEDGRIYNDVIIQLAMDREFTEGLVTIYNNDTDNSNKQGAGTDPEEFKGELGYQIKFAPVKAKYIRVWESGNTENFYYHICELQVFKVAEE